MSILDEVFVSVMGHSIRADKITKVFVAVNLGYHDRSGEWYVLALNEVKFPLPEAVKTWCEKKKIEVESSPGSREKLDKDWFSSGIRGGRLLLNLTVEGYIRTDIEQVAIEGSQRVHQGRGRAYDYNYKPVAKKSSELEFALGEKELKDFIENFAKALEACVKYALGTSVEGIDRRFAERVTGTQVQSRR